MAQEEGWNVSPAGPPPGIENPMQTGSDYQALMAKEKERLKTAKEWEAKCKMAAMNRKLREENEAMQKEMEKLRKVKK